MKKINLTKMRLKLKPEIVRRLTADDLKQIHGGYQSDGCGGDGWPSKDQN